MNSIPNIQNTPVLVWDGATAIERKIVGYIRYGFTAEAIADIATDAVFKFQAAPPSAADTCAAGTYIDVEEVAICTAPAVGALEEVIIPAGTKKGQLCHFTLPCWPDTFLKLAAVSGDTANLRVCMVLSGPKF